MFANDGESSYPVKVIHWWPGRQYKSVPIILHLMIGAARKLGSRYATIAFIEDDSGLVWFKWSLCMQTDTPSRRIGRDIAIGRLKKLLLASGFIVNDGSA